VNFVPWTPVGFVALSCVVTTSHASGAVETTDQWRLTTSPLGVEGALIIRATVPPFAPAHPDIKAVMRGFTLTLPQLPLKGGWPPGTTLGEA